MRRKRYIKQAEELTGIPAEVRIMASSVEEKIKLCVAFAALYFVSTRRGSDSERPRSILARDCHGTGDGDD